MPETTDTFTPGRRVAVTQQIPQRDEVWTHRLEGVVVKFEQRKTGSWFAHAKDDKLWLDRLVIRKDDGEIVVLALDEFTHVAPLPGGEAPSAAAGGRDAQRAAGQASDQGADEGQPT